MNNSGPSMIASATATTAVTVSTAAIDPPAGYQVVLDWAMANVTNAGASTESVAIEVPTAGTTYRITERATVSQTVSVFADFPGGWAIGPGSKQITGKTMTTTAGAPSNANSVTINVGYHFEVG